MNILFAGIVLILVVDFFYSKYRRNPYGTWE